MHRVVAITVLVLAVLAPRAARADNVDQLIAQLEDDSEKVRLSAALNLTKIGVGDTRTVSALAKRLTDDSSADVRRIAVVGLRTLVTDKVKGTPRTVALDALKKAAASDSNDTVKRNAQIAFDLINGQGGGTVTPGTGGGVYVNVGPMSSKTGSANDAKLRELMNKTAGKTLNKVASTMQTTWPGGATPTKTQLAAKNVQGFYVDGTLNELKVEKAGSSSKVSCKISMLLASFPDKSVFGFLNGNAAVAGSASDRDIALAGEDCVTAVVEDLIAKKIVPTIKSKVGP